MRRHCPECRGRLIAKIAIRQISPSHGLWLRQATCAACGYSDETSWSEFEGFRITVEVNNEPRPALRADLNGPGEK